jgi:C-terminal processing protease CtpA/Prc
LQILKGELGLQVRLDDINSCILRITKVFQGSPLQKYNIQSGDFIVGVLEGNFNCIKTFAQLITNITTIAPKANISLGICGEDGKTRIVIISVV